MQPGLQRMVLRLEELVQRIDGEQTQVFLLYSSTIAETALFWLL